jgi:hypothetical protein
VSRILGNDRGTALPRRICAAAVIALASLLSAPPVGEAASGGSHWVGSWMAAPSDGLAPPLLDQTVRVVAVPHLRGKRVRLRLTNRFGKGPLVLSHVTIARKGRRAGIVASTVRTVRFGGRISARIPKGADVLSDQVSMRLRAGHAVVVSIAVSGAVSAPTEHLNTREINYRTRPGSGNHTRDLSGMAFVRSSRAGSTGASSSRDWTYARLAEPPPSWRSATRSPTPIRAATPR